jgi:tRNA(Ile2) C34 agmatinyltransferase TiaS
MGNKPAEVKIIDVQLQRKIPLVPKTCPVCGKNFAGASLAKYDSQQCKQKAAYDRHAKARRATRRAKYQAEKEGGPGKKEAKARGLTLNRRGKANAI